MGNTHRIFSPYIARHITILYKENDVYMEVVERTLIPKLIYRLRIIDPDIYIYKARLIDAIGENIRIQADLDNWVRVSNVIQMPLSQGVGYLDLCEFWRAALLKATNAFIKEQNDAQKEVMRSIESKMEKDVQHRSMFDTIPKPNLSSYS